MVKFVIKSRREFVKKTAYLLILFSLLTCALTSSACAEAVPVGISDSIAVITDYKGGCGVKPMAAGEWQSASFGRPVYEGDEFRTSAESFMEITFDDATLVRLDENAALKLSSLKRDKKTGVAKTIFNLTIGKMLAVVDKLLNPESSFEVHTKMAIAAVKGTQLAVNSNDTGDTLGVFDGSVLFTGADGSNGVQVNGGNESATGADGRPGVPEALREMLKDREKMEKMRETIKNMTALKQQGLLAVFLSAKNEDAGKEEKINRPDNRLKNRLRRDMRETRKRAFTEMAYVTDQTKIDNYLGKSVIDVHGNRVRFEDYVLRPAIDLGGGQSENKEVDYLNLTYRENSLNLIKTSYLFEQPLPETIPDEYWQTHWVGYYPSNNMISKNTLISNGSDKIETNTFFELRSETLWGYSGTQPPPGQVLIKTLEEMQLNGSIKEKRYFQGELYGDPSFGYQMSKDTLLDQTWGLPYAPDASRLVYSPYYEEPVNPMRPNDRSVIKHYNDGTTIRLDYYYIYDNGVQAVAAPGQPAYMMDPYELMNRTNVEVKISSNAFSRGDIDLVSKIMWLHLLNPPGMSISTRTWDLLDPNHNDEFNLIYLNNLP